MTFYSVGSALRCYAQAVRSDGPGSTFPTVDCLLPRAGRRPDPDDRLLTLWAIGRALQLLPKPDRDLLHLVYIEEEPVLDVAARWNRHPSRIYARLTRARAQLARRLEVEGLLAPRESP